MLWTTELYLKTKLHSLTNNKQIMIPQNLGSDRKLQSHLEGKKAYLVNNLIN